jgi:hypothetical protein
MGMGHLVGSLHLLHVLHHLLAHLLPHHLPHIGQPARGVEFPPLHFFVPANIDKLGQLQCARADEGRGRGGTYRLELRVLGLQLVHLRPQPLHLPPRAYISIFKQAVRMTELAGLYIFFSTAVCTSSTRSSMCTSSHSSAGGSGAFITASPCQQQPRITIQQCIHGTR